MGYNIAQLREEAKKDPARVILPEGHEIRVLKAAEKVTSLHIADIILIGKEEDIKNKAKANSINIEKVRIVDPAVFSRTQEVIDVYYELVKHKVSSREEAGDTVLKDPVYFGALLVRMGEAEGFVAGASHTTANVARAAFYGVGLDRNIGTMSSCFVIEFENSPYGDKGLFIFGDCGIVPKPNAKRLADIAISSSKLYKELFRREPLVALLSYSTKGSAKGESVEKIGKALDLLKSKAPGLIADGELQLDAAVDPEVAKIKAPGSPVAGKANVLIFPNLDSGNISYKLAQRLGNAGVVGPILQGLAKPCSDLSRGCGVEEIVDAVAVIVLRSRRC